MKKLYHKGVIMIVEKTKSKNQYHKKFASIDQIQIFVGILVQRSFEYRLTWVMTCLWKSNIVVENCLYTDKVFDNSGIQIESIFAEEIRCIAYDKFLNKTQNKIYHKIEMECFPTKLPLLTFALLLLSRSILKVEATRILRSVSFCISFATTISQIPPIIIA